MKRYTFGITELSDGIGFIVVAVGIFAMAEIIANLGNPEERTHLRRQGHPPVSDLGRHRSHRQPILRGTAIGCSSACCPVPAR